MRDWGLKDRFAVKVVPLRLLALRPGARIPGGASEVSRKALGGLVRGMKAPVYVKALGEGYQIIAGDSEFTAAKERDEESMAVMVGEISDKEALLMRLYEGARRRDLNVVEEATIIRELVEEYGLTQHEIAVYTERAQPTVSNKLRLLRLPQEVLEGLKEGTIGERHARALLKVPGEDEQVKAYRNCVKFGFSAQEMERRCSRAHAIERRRASRQNPRGVVKDVRIFKNAFRSVVKEMQKAGLSVSSEEKNVGKGWEFRVSLTVPES